MKTYPRLAIRLRHRSRLVQVSVSHRQFRMVPVWVLLLVNRPGDEHPVYEGCDDTIYGWISCVDWAERTVAQARSQS